MSHRWLLAAGALLLGATALALEIKVPLVRHDPEIRRLAEEPATLYLALQNAEVVFSNPSAVDWQTPQKLRLTRTPAVPVRALTLDFVGKSGDQLKYEIGVEWNLWVEKAVRLPVTVTFSDEQVIVVAKELSVPLPFGLSERLLSTAERLFSAENQSRIRDYLQRKHQSDRHLVSRAIREEWKKKFPPRKSQSPAPEPFPFGLGLSVLLFAWAWMLVNRWRARLRSRKWTILFEEMPEESRVTPLPAREKATLGGSAIEFLPGA